MSTDWPSSAMIFAWGVYIALIAAVTLKWSFGPPTLDLSDKPSELLPIFLAIAPPVIFFAARRTTGKRARTIYDAASLVILALLLLASIFLVLIYRGPIA